MKSIPAGRSPAGNARLIVIGNGWSRYPSGGYSSRDSRSTRPTNEVKATQQRKRSPEKIAAGSAVSVCPASRPSRAALNSQIWTITSRTINAKAHKFLALPLQKDARQAPRRRSLQNGTIRRGKIAVMTRASQSIRFLLIINRAREMRALLAEGGGFVFCGPHEDAAVRRRRIGEPFAAAYGNLSDPGHHGTRKHSAPCEIRACQNPEVAHEHAETRECQEFCELTPGHVALIRGVN